MKEEEFDDFVQYVEREIAKQLGIPRELLEGKIISAWETATSIYWLKLWMKLGGASNV